MNVVGIVAEYNPLHNGHVYQIKRIQELYDSPKICVVMSGDYIQRGGPAICKKQIRAEAAIKAGASEVIELPVYWSTADAPVFAQAAVDILNDRGCSKIAFGSESGNITWLKQIADCMLTEEYNDHYQLLSAHGMPSNEARIAAVKKVIEVNDPDSINNPNNLLGIYYILAIRRRGYDIEPVTIKRAGQGYFESSVNADEIFASATAIRKMIYKWDREKDSGSLEQFRSYLPSYMFESLINEAENEGLKYKEDYYPLIQAGIKQVSKEKKRELFPGVPDNVLERDLAKAVSYEEMKKALTRYVPGVKADRYMFRCYLYSSGKMSAHSDEKYTVLCPDT